MYVFYIIGKWEIVGGISLKWLSDKIIKWAENAANAQQHFLPPLFRHFHFHFLSPFPTSPPDTRPHVTLPSSRQKRRRRGGYQPLLGWRCQSSFSRLHGYTAWHLTMAPLRVTARKLNIKAGETRLRRLLSIFRFRSRHLNASHVQLIYPQCRDWTAAHCWSAVESLISSDRFHHVTELHGTNSSE